MDKHIVINKRWSFCGGGGFIKDNNMTNYYRTCRNCCGTGWVCQLKPRESEVAELKKFHNMFGLSEEEFDNLSDVELEWFKVMKERILVLKQQINMRRAEEGFFNEN